MSDPPAMPRLAGMPLRGPPFNACPSTYIMSFPGVRLRLSAAVRKINRSAELTGINGFLECQEITPGQALLARLLEQVTGMKTWQHPNFFIGHFEIKPFAAKGKKSFALA